MDVRAAGGSVPAPAVHARVVGLDGVTRTPDPVVLLQLGVPPLQATELFPVVTS